MSCRRRDPRSELAAQTVASSPRRRIVRGRIPEKPSRLRRNPRAEREARRIPGAERSRYLLSRSAPVASLAPTRLAAVEPLDVVRIEDPAFLVLAVLSPGPTLTEKDRRLVGGARMLADAGNGAVVALTPHDEVTLGLAGVDRVLRQESEDNDYKPEQTAAAVVEAILQLEPRWVLFDDDPTGGGDIARRVAAGLGERMFAGLERIEHGRGVRRAEGGLVELISELPRLITAAADAMPSHAGPPHEARPLDQPVGSSSPSPARIGDARLLPSDPQRVPLSEAEFVVGCGNGVQDLAQFAALARALGAAQGASRVVCDAGNMPRDRQIGASGTVIRARCYLTLGIAGAPQHLQGITDVEMVIAVNTDPHCEMVKRADLAVVGDVQAIMPALERRARERRRT